MFAYIIFSFVKELGLGNLDKINNGELTTAPDINYQHIDNANIDNVNVSIHGTVAQQ